MGAAQSSAKAGEAQATTASMHADRPGSSGGPASSHPSFGGLRRLDGRRRTPVPRGCRAGATPPRFSPGSVAQILPVRLSCAITCLGPETPRAAHAPRLHASSPQAPRLPLPRRRRYRLGGGPRAPRLSSGTSSGLPETTSRRRLSCRAATSRLWSPPLPSRRARLPQHKHPFQRYAHVLQGELRVRQINGSARIYRAGRFVAEIVGRWHYGEALGAVPVRLLVIDQLQPGRKATIVRPGGD